jgi:hypothetical protein
MLRDQIVPVARFCDITPLPDGALGGLAQEQWGNDPQRGPYKPLASQIYGTLRLLAEDRENTSATPVFLNNHRLRRAD